MTPLPVSIAAAVASFALLVVVFELIRSRRLRERYALLWLLTGVVLLGLSLWRDGLNTIAGWFGVETYPPALLGAVAELGIVQPVRRDADAVRPRSRPWAIRERGPPRRRDRLAVEHAVVCGAADPARA